MYNNQFNHWISSETRAVSCESCLGTWLFCPHRMAWVSASIVECRVSSLLIFISFLYHFCIRDIWLEPHSFRLDCQMNDIFLVTFLVRKLDTVEGFLRWSIGAVGNQFGKRHESRSGKQQKFFQTKSSEKLPCFVREMTMRTQRQEKSLIY